MESCAIIVNGRKLFTIVTKLSILDICSGPGYTSGEHNPAHFRVGTSGMGLKSIKWLKYSENESELEVKKHAWANCAPDTDRLCSGAQNLYSVTNFSGTYILPWINEKSRSIIFYSIWGFSPWHSRFTGKQGKEKTILNSSLSLTSASGTLTH